MVLYRVGGPSETNTTVLKLQNIYTLMNIKQTCKSTPHTHMYNTAPHLTLRKIYVTSALSRVKSAAASPISQMNRPRHGWRSPLCSTSSKSRFTQFPEPRNAFHMRQDAVPIGNIINIGNIIVSRSNVSATFIRPSREKKSCAPINNYDSTDQPNSTPQTPARRLQAPEVTFR